jgi:hypothetical protein
MTTIMDININVNIRHHSLHRLLCCVIMGLSQYESKWKKYAKTLDIQQKWIAT